MISPINPRSRIRRRSVYWTFWKVVFAGWLIRYPKPFFVSLGLIAALIYHAVK